MGSWKAGSSFWCVIFFSIRLGSLVLFVLKLLGMLVARVVGSEVLAPDGSDRDCLGSYRRRSRQIDVEFKFGKGSIPLGFTFSGNQDRLFGRNVFSETKRTETWETWKMEPGAIRH
ncbi:hypothetical protein B0T18DRAFT_417128 [Schizothecium vesticola]|uniref:Uncharacterized protein n=1 Tax=Schizothecium vesticola TaxID=314040 RepID=A0AA40BTH1_9PEZI|nr:hypothetical protein B0T18DRAFT_417128 [Schizothecium vesticola]